MAPVNLVLGCEKDGRCGTRFFFRRSTFRSDLFLCLFSHVFIYVCVQIFNSKHIHSCADLLHLHLCGHLRLCTFTIFTSVCTFTSVYIYICVHLLYLHLCAHLRLCTFTIFTSVCTLKMASIISHAIV